MRQPDERILKIRKALRHDLRNPLTIILGRCELLENGTLGAMPNPQVDSLRAISRNAQRLTDELDVLAQLLDSWIADGGASDPPGGTHRG